MIEVRPASPHDEDRLFELLTQLIGESIARSEPSRAVFRSLLEGARGGVLVAVEEGTVLGVITVSYNPAIRYGGDYAQVEELVIDEAARGRQLGATLVRSAIDAARQRGCKEIGLYAREANLPFYEKLGFEFAGAELRLKLS